jgi:hypothetical protein
MTKSEYAPTQPSCRLLTEDTPARLFMPAATPLPPGEQLTAAMERKEKGNAAYKAGRVSRAVRQYTAAYENANSISERDLAPNPVTEGDEEGVSTSAIRTQVRGTGSPSTDRTAGVVCTQLPATSMMGAPTCVMHQCVCVCMV